MMGSPDSEGSLFHQSPNNRRKCDSSRKNRTPNTLRHMMEKHRHSERKRHHSLNERLKAICQLVPGSAQDNRETKVVMMQRGISYLAYLENSIKLLCNHIGNKPHPKWVLLTNNFNSYFRDYFKGIDDLDTGDDEVLAATQNLAQSLKAQDEESCPPFHSKVSSPTVDSTTDSVVPVVVPQAEEVMPSSSLSRNAEHVTPQWTMYSICQNIPVVRHALTGASKSKSSKTESFGDSDVFFSSSADDGVSAVLEISSSTDDRGCATKFGPGYTAARTDHKGSTAFSASILQPALHPHCVDNTIHNFYTIEKHVPEVIPRRHKRKQLSPRRSASQDDNAMADSAFQSSCSTAAQNSLGRHAEEQSAHKVRVFPYNIRCNHRHPVQRLQTTGSRHGADQPPVVTVVRSSPQPSSLVSPKLQNKMSTKLDLRKTSWMNGFMMFSRLNRRNFIQAHPGVHTSHISKIMGHAWRNMSAEEQAPYKEKAKLCAKELYRVYTSQPEFQMYSPIPGIVATTADCNSAPCSFTTKSAATTLDE